MPVLNFKGKSIIHSCHLGAPFRSLDICETKSLPPKARGGKKSKPGLDDNLIINGDNFHALKALMPRYAGKVKCIYIDPPYNTGKETWIFNDNVNSPAMRDWLNKEVGADDQERHDKWLCMMWPRLHLLKGLLSDEGVLICAIDHNEREHLGLILKEIFPDREVACVTIVHNPRGIQGKNFSYTHEYAYFVLPDKNIIKEKRLEKADISNFRNWGGESKRENAKNCFYPVIVKNSKVIGFGDALEEGRRPKKQTVKRADGSYEVYPIDMHGVERKWRYSRENAESIKRLLMAKQAKNGKERFEIEIGKESLRIFQDSGRFIDFFPDPGDFLANEKLLSEVKNLDFKGELSQRFGGSANISIKQSLGNALRIARPVIVLDEGHRAYSELARDTVSKLNPRFILELSATPNMKEHRSNVLTSVSGVKLKEEEMIKIPINISNSEKGDWRKTLSQAYEKLLELDKAAQKYFKASSRYIRPIMLVQAERTGADQRGGKFVHSEDAKEYLVRHLGARPDEVRIKTSGRNELKDEDLLSGMSPVRHIITNKALQEGWDCPFAYVLALLGKSQSKQALTQLIGRVLRQPHAKEIKQFPSLNESYVFCYNRAVQDVVEDIKRGLQKEGMDDAADQIKSSGGSLRRETARRRKKRSFRNRIFLPRVLYKDRGKWRKMIYEADILSNIDYSKISYSKMEDLRPEAIEALKTDIVAVGLEERNGLLALPEVQRRASEGGALPLDFLLMAQRLCNFIPNPLEAGRILDEALLSLKNKKISDKTIWLNRNFILNEIEKDISAQAERMSERLFADKLKKGEIYFKIFKDRIDLNWEMGMKIDFIVSGADKVLRRRNDTDLQLSLFDKTYEKHYNPLEKKAAWHLDESEAIKWRRRMAAKKDYHLQGWQKRKVWPDFLACAVSGSQGDKYIVLETKGDHLKGNEDTKYKEKLFHLLKRYHKKPVDAGDLEAAAPEEEKMVFKILMEASWETDLQTALKES